MPVLMSCTAGVVRCDDTGSGLGLPGDVLGPFLLGALLVGAAIAVLLIRALRRRPPWER